MTAQVKVGLNNIIKHANLAFRLAHYEDLLGQHTHILVHSFHVAIQLMRAPAEGGRRRAGTYSDECFLGAMALLAGIFWGAPGDRQGVGGESPPR